MTSAANRDLDFIRTDANGNPQPSAQLLDPGPHSRYVETGQPEISPQLQIVGQVVQPAADRSGLTPTATLSRLLSCLTPGPTHDTLKQGSRKSPRNFRLWGRLSNLRPIDPD